MINNHERIIWSLALLGVVIWGGLRGNSGDGKVAAPAQDGGKAAASQGGRDRSGEGGLRGERPPRDEAGLRKYANHALSTPSRTERFKRVMIMVDEVTPDNWRTIWTEYIRQTLAEGRVHEAEWGLFMNRVGEVAGPDAMEYFTHNAQNQYTFNRREILSGWAAQDPQGAWRWLQSQPEDKRPPEFWQAVMDGAAAKDPKIALGWLAEAPAEVATRVAPRMVTSQIQADGLAGTIKSVEEMAAATPEGQQQPAYLAAFYKELSDRVRRMKWLAEAYPDVPSTIPDLAPLNAMFGITPNTPPGLTEQR